MEIKDTILLAVIALICVIACAALFLRLRERSKEIGELEQQLNEQHEKTANAQRQHENVRTGLKAIDEALRFFPIPFWFRDEQNNIRYANNHFNRVIKEGKVTSQLEHETITQDLYNLAAAAKESNSLKGQNVTIELESKEKIYKMFECPKPSGTVGFAIDITDVGYLQSQLKNFVISRDTMLENITTAVAIFAADKRLTYFNSAYTKLWKLDQTWLNERPTYGEILEKLRQERMLPEQIDFKTYKQEKNEYFTALREPQEEFYHLPDNSSFRVVTIPDNVGGLIINCEDMTHRLSLERENNQYSNVQTETIQKLQEGIAVFGENGKLKIWNSLFASLWGIEEDALDEDMTLNNVMQITKERYKTTRNWNEFKLGILTTTSTERRHKTFDLELIKGTILKASIQPLPNGDILTSFNDITDSVEIQRALTDKNNALRDADQIKNDFMANVSYELRSPLTSIVGFTEMLGQGIAGEVNPKQKHYLDDIKTSSNKLSSLIDNVIDISTIDAGIMLLEPTEFNVEDAVSEVLVSLTPKLVGKEFEFNTTFKGRSRIIMADRKRFKQIVKAVVSNSIDFTPKEQGKVDIEANCTTSGLTISIKDNGQGIAEQDQKNMFKKFATLTGNKRSGTGLSLYLAKKLIELHSGNISLKSTLDTGTIVEINIPNSKPKTKGSNTTTKKIISKATKAKRAAKKTSIEIVQAKKIRKKQTKPKASAKLSSKEKEG